MVNGKDIVCWGFGGIFFFLAFIGFTPSYEITDLNLARIILFGLIGLTLTISGSIFNLQQEEDSVKRNL